MNLNLSTPNVPTTQLTKSQYKIINQYGPSYFSDINLNPVQDYINPMVSIALGMVAKQFLPKFITMSPITSTFIGSLITAANLAKDVVTSTSLTSCVLNTDTLNTYYYGATLVSLAEQRNVFDAKITNLNHKIKESLEFKEDLKELDISEIKKIKGIYQEKLSLQTEEEIIAESYTYSPMKFVRHLLNNEDHKILTFDQILKKSNNIDAFKSALLKNKEILGANSDVIKLLQQDLQTNPSNIVTEENPVVTLEEASKDSKVLELLLNYKTKPVTEFVKDISNETGISGVVNYIYNESLSDRFHNIAEAILPNNAYTSLTNYEQQADSYLKQHVGKPYDLVKEVYNSSPKEIVDFARENYNTKSWPEFYNAYVDQFVPNVNLPAIALSVGTALAANGISSCFSNNAYSNPYKLIVADTLLTAVTTKFSEHYLGFDETAQNYMGIATGLVSGFGPLVYSGLTQIYSGLTNMFTHTSNELAHTRTELVDLNNVYNQLAYKHQDVVNELVNSQAANNFKDLVLHQTGIDLVNVEANYDAIKAGFRALFDANPNGDIHHAIELIYDAHPEWA